MEARGWADERLRALALEALALDALDDEAQALHRLGEALALARLGGYLRLFLDEGPAMARLLAQAGAQGDLPDTVTQLLAAFEAEPPPSPPAHAASAAPAAARHSPTPLALAEPLSQRELEVLQLIAQGLSNREIAERLSLALDTVKGHNRSIFGKLQVQRRTEAVARARALGLI
jgi:LuxR family maltose regulon positive regulatory protein